MYKRVKSMSSACVKLYVAVDVLAVPLGKSLTMGGNSILCRALRLSTPYLRVEVLGLRVCCGKSQWHPLPHCIGINDSV